MEEERRICYVGITRAEEYLYLTAAKQRTIFGSTSCNKISRFIGEIPKDLLDGMENIKEEKKYVYEYDWEYGTKKRFEEKQYNDKFNKQIPTFQYRSAESFLENINNKVKPETDISIYKEGQNVYHKKFGEGTIDKIEKEGDDLKLDITFEKMGHKRLMAKYANLEIKQ